MAEKKDEQAKRDAALDREATKVADQTTKEVAEAQARQEQEQQEARREELRAATKERLAREQALADTLAQNPPDGKELTTGEVRAPRAEEAAQATTQVSIQQQTQRERTLAQDVQAAQSAAAAAHGGGQIVISEAILRSAQAASAAAELAGLGLDQAGPGGPVYIVGGVEVDADGVPIATKQQRR